MKKRIKGREYLYLYKTRWVDGKPKSLFVKYIGPKDKFNDESLRKILGKE